ncbi:MAG: glycoside hydrolase family 5 protein [Lachnospiraceae bacterium]|nr:glycoside hydrolase family 5 protein [Lachnospiraceae bacterium]
MKLWWKDLERKTEFNSGQALRMGFWILMVVLLILVTQGCGPRPAEDPPQEDEKGLPALCVREGELCDTDGHRVQLRGMSTHGMAWFPQYCNARAFQSVKEAGGNVIRLAMYTDTDNGYLADPQGNLLRMRLAVEDALAVGLYVIVDWHILSDGNPNEHLSEAITFFDAMASAYRDEPGVLYEICNEPNRVRWDEIQQYAYAIVPVIRQYAPDAVILVGTPDYSSGIAEAAASPLPMENLLYSYHFYAGEKDQYLRLKQAVDDHFPVFVSEWGIGRKRDESLALSEGRDFVNYLNEKKISWCAWSLCNKEEPYSALRPECAAYGGFSREDLTDTGKVYYDALGVTR